MVPGRSKDRPMMGTAVVQAQKGLGRSAHDLLVRFHPCRHPRRRSVAVLTRSMHPDPA